VSLGVATVMIHVLGTRLSRSDHALAHKLVLFRASHQFAGGRDPKRISEITLAATVCLAAGDRPGCPVRAAVAIGPDGRLEVTAATRCLEPAIGARLCLARGRVRPVQPDQPQLRPLASLLDRASTTALVELIGARGTVRGALLFDAASPVPPICARRWSGCATRQGLPSPAPRRPRS
jgi:hypothetical protein